MVRVVVGGSAARHKSFIKDLRMLVIAVKATGRPAGCLTPIPELLSIDGAICEYRLAVP